MSEAAILLALHREFHRYGAAVVTIHEDEDELTVVIDGALVRVGQAMLTSGLRYRLLVGAACLYTPLRSFAYADAAAAAALAADVAAIVTTARAHLRGAS